MDREEALKIVQSATVWTDEEREALAMLIPELADSEDERIRKELVEKISNLACGCFISQEQKQKFVAYLEKQKENPKSADSIPSDCTSDAKYEDRDSEYGVFPEDVIVVARACKKLETHGYSELAHALKNVNLYTKEQKSVDYDHEMWKNCEANFEGGKKEVIEHPEKYGLQKPVEWSEEDETRLTNTLIMLKEYAIHHYSKDDVEKSVDWLENRVKFLRPQPKQEWSEEDEHRRTDAIYFLESAKSHYADTSEIEKTILWLKSLRPSWKPCEEQMDELQGAITYMAIHNMKVDSLVSLHKELKKL